MRKSSPRSRKLIATRIAPALAADGGEVGFHSFENGVLQLDVSGPAVGLLGSIGNLVRHYIPEVTTVREHRDLSDRPGLETPAGQAVQRLLDEEINPAVAGHGGYISLIDVQDNNVYIRLEGGCHDCGMADVTLKQGHRDDPSTRTAGRSPRSMT